VKPDKVKIGIIQFTPAHLHIKKNFHYVKDEISRLARLGAEIILLPELWATGPLFPNDDLKKKVLSGLIQDLADLSQELDIYVAGTMPEFVHGMHDQALNSSPEIYNTTYLFGPDEYGPVYRKIHLFPPMDEDKIFTPGHDPSFLFLNLNGGRRIGVGFLTCFDLRFPELFRFLAFNGIQLMLISSLWPKTRIEAFKILLRARAIESQCYVAASNAWGMSGGIFFGGGSCVAEPDGDMLIKAKDKENSIIAKIDLNQIAVQRDKFFTARPPRGWIPRASKKITGTDEIKDIAIKRRRTGQKMVFTNGCFDLIHAGHVSYLEKARNLGDFLVVGLNSDKSVRTIKGNERPVMPQESRARVLASLSSVDYVVIFDELTPESLICSILPDFLVKGSDWKEDEIVGADTVKKKGGKVVRISLLKDFSSTSIIKKLQESP
jgi:rfaE bifunctional protein nucleotidyltransferase chain/domain